jgi:hypothetical protein
VLTSPATATATTQKAESRKANGVNGVVGQHTTRNTTRRQSRIQTAAIPNTQTTIFFGFMALFAITFFVFWGFFGEGVQKHNPIQKQKQKRLPKYHVENFFFDGATHNAQHRTWHVFI